MKYILYLFTAFIFFPATAQDSEKVASALEYQQELNMSFKNPKTSPLSAEERESFESLDFFPVDTSFYVVAEFVRTPYETPFAMPTTTDREPIYVKYGEAYFSLNGKEYKLNLYQSRDLSMTEAYKYHLFLPFTDLTNGNTTYAGGRYVDLKIPKTNKIIIDFNKAYNPYCAYNGKYSCPIPPQENHLETFIKAGVKKY